LIAKQGVRWNYATPLMNQSNKINGIQITYQTDSGCSHYKWKFINLENFKDEDWQFRTEVVKAGYKRYTKVDNELMFLLVEA